MMYAVGAVGTRDALERDVIAPKLDEYVARLFPGATLLATEPLAPDSGATASSTAKVAGYGEPVRLVVDDHGVRHELVWHVAAANEFGHDRRADRAAEILLAHDDFAAIPNHVQPIDVGAVGANGALISLRNAGELYLVTTYARGTIYADSPPVPRPSSATSSAWMRSRATSRRYTPRSPTVPSATDARSAI